jgi:hypothetical protein
MARPGLRSMAHCDVEVLGGGALSHESNERDPNRSVIGRVFPYPETINNIVISDSCIGE